MAEPAESEEKKVWPRRRCLVLDPIVTDALHKAGKVIWYDGPDTPNLIRSLTEDELNDFADNEEREAAPVVPDVGSKDAFIETARRDIILEALAKLDHTRDSEWTESGQPTVNAVGRALMNMGVTKRETSRPEIRKVAPNFKRKEKELDAVKEGVI